MVKQHGMTQQNLHCGTQAQNCTGFTEKKDVLIHASHGMKAHKIDPSVDIGYGG